MTDPELTLDEFLLQERERLVSFEAFWRGGMASGTRSFLARMPNSEWDMALYSHTPKDADHG